MRKRRTNIEVIADILRLGEARKTEIMYGANMSYKQLQRYLDSLIEGGFIERLYLSEQAERYKVTVKGNILLDNIDSISDMFSTRKKLRKPIVKKMLVSQVVSGSSNKRREEPI